MRSCFYILLVIGLLTACRKEAVKTLPYIPSLMEIPRGFPEVTFPADNEFSLARWQLGKKLFYDPVMSVDSSISCASCHRADLAFSDNIDFSLGVQDRLGIRNAPSLANVAYHPYFTREGGVPTLEMQVLIPIQEHIEFDFNIVLLAERLNSDTIYLQMAQQAYERVPDPFVITRALACFERSLLSGYSAYDQFEQYGLEEALSTKARRGMDLFFGPRTNCSTCHSGFNFTNYAFENNGLFEQYADEGRFRLTGKEEDRGLFKVPSLRNVALTAPYMHDGSIPTLEEVVEHYRCGGQPHPNKNKLLQALDLNDTEKNDLIEFLKSLTDETFTTHPLFIN